MPYHKSCLKAIRVADRHHERNTAGRSRLKNAMKSVLALSKKDGADAILCSAFSVIDKSAKAGLIHKKNALNKKSRLAKFVNALA
jgi:small subunit ribosomal protein S20